MARSVECDHPDCNGRHRFGNDGRKHNMCPAAWARRLQRVQSDTEYMERWREANPDKMVGYQKARVRSGRKAAAQSRYRRNLHERQARED